MKCLKFWYIYKCGVSCNVEECSNVNGFFWKTLTRWPGWRTCLWKRGTESQCTSRSLCLEGNHFAILAYRETEKWHKNLPLNIYSWNTSLELDCINMFVKSRLFNLDYVMMRNKIKSVLSAVYFWMMKDNLLKTWNIF